MDSGTAGSEDKGRRVQEQTAGSDPLSDHLHPSMESPNSPPQARRAPRCQLACRHAYGPPPQRTSDCEDDEEEEEEEEEEMEENPEVVRRRLTVRRMLAERAAAMRSGTSAPAVTSNRAAQSGERLVKRQQDGLPEAWAEYNRIMGIKAHYAYDMHCPFPVLPPSAKRKPPDNALALNTAEGSTGAMETSESGAQAEKRPVRDSDGTLVDMSATNDEAPCSSKSTGQAPAKLICTICAVGEVNAVLIPCYHALCCLECAARIKGRRDMAKHRCPLCKKWIVEFKKVFIGYFV